MKDTSGQQQHVIMTFQTVEEVKADPGVDIAIPQPEVPVLTNTCLQTANKEEHKDQILNPVTQKLLYVYTAKSATNQNIQIMCDPGATLSVLNSRALDKVGELKPNGTTKLKG